MGRKSINKRKNPRSAQRGDASTAVGRPTNAKSSTRIFREAMQQGFELALKESFLEILHAVVDAAKDGDMQAAKMLLDRVVPVQQSGTEGGGTKIDKIVVNVGTVTADSDGGVVIDAQVEDA